MKKNNTKKAKPPQHKPEANTLEKEIEEMIDREKTKGRIVSKLINQAIPLKVKTSK